MRPWRRTASAAIALSALSLALSAEPASAGPEDQPFTFAVIGDMPYGDAQAAEFPKVVAQINADPDVQLVGHLGDIKSGSSVCSDEYFHLIRSQFDTFKDPLVYTPGDNEWTDCHRPSAGPYNPLERLAAIREVFFPRPGWTLGQHSVRVTSGVGTGHPENVTYRRAGVAFAAVHIVGSNNGMAPWTGSTAPTPEQAAEVRGRTAATVQSIHDTFDKARRNHNKAVALLTQADMFDPTVKDAAFADYDAFQPIVRTIADESARFSGPVYLFNGDSHAYNSDKPLDTGSTWLSFYGIKAAAPNLSRVTVDGSSNGTNYLKVTVHPGSEQVLTWTRVPFAF